MFRIAQIKCSKLDKNVPQKVPVPLTKTLLAVERVMDMNERQNALSVLESLRGDLVYAHLNNGSRVLDVADLRQYIYEQMSRIRTNALVTDGLYGNVNGHGQDISKSNGHNGEMAWRLKSSLFSSSETTLRLCRNI